MQTRRRVRLARVHQVKADLLDGSRCEWTDQVRLRHVGTDCVLSVVLSVRSASGAVPSAGSSSRETSRRSRLTWDLARQISRDLDRGESGGARDGAGDDSARKEARTAPPFLRRTTSRSASRSTFLVELDDEMVEVVPTSDLTSELSLFELVPQYQATKGHVGLHQLMRIRHVATGYWLHCPPATALDTAERDDVEGAAAAGAAAAGAAVAGAAVAAAGAGASQLTKLRATRVMRDEDVFGLVAVVRTEEADIHFAKDISEKLRAFWGAPSWQPGALAERAACDFKPLLHLLSELIVFVTSTDEIDPLKREGLPIFSRQTLLREQGVIELVLLSLMASDVLGCPP